MSSGRPGWRLGVAGEVGLLLFAALLLGGPLAFGRLPAGHDVATYLMYGREAAANLREGIALPSWAAELNGGFGGPGLLLYPPLVSVLHAALFLAGLPLPVALSLSGLAGLLVSGLSARLWLRAAGAGSAALPAALVYMAAPYRILDLYERTNLSEHWAFVFPPLVLYAAAAALPRGRRVGLVALAVGGLLLTNTPLALLFAALFAAWLVSPAGPVGRRVDVAAGAALGAGIAALLLVPQAFASRWIATELWYGPAARGFRPSENGLFSSSALDGPFNLRASVAVVATVLLLAVAGLAWRPESRSGRAFWLGAGLAALVATLGPVGPVWDAAPLLSKAQFPWRLGAVLTLALAAAVGHARTSRAGALLAAVGALAGAPFVGASTTTWGLAAPIGAPGAREAAAPGGVEAAKGSSTEAWTESRNVWMRNPRLTDVWYIPRSLAPAGVAELFQGGRAVYPALGEKLAAVPSDAEARVVEVHRARLRRAVEVETQAGGLVVLRALDLPGFSVSVDGRPARAERDAASGFLAVRVPEGRHLVAWAWTAPPGLVAARAISAASALAALALVFLSRRRPAAPRS